MKTDIIGIRNGIVGVEVVDPRGNRHLVEINVEDEDVEDFHAQESYSHTSSERTPEEEQIMNQVRARARFEAHKQTEYDIIPSGWNPTQLRRGIEALENMPVDEFDEAFREYYHALIDPERTKSEYGITEGSVEFEGEPQIALIVKGFCINDDNEVINVLPDMYIYYSKEDIEETYTTGTPACCSEGTTQITPMVPPFVEVPEDFVYPEDFRGSEGTTQITPMVPPFVEVPEDFVYPEDFRGFLINNLICQIRDVYRNMGETPPKQYDIEGYGKPKGNFDRDKY
ncbi:hypothetical protein C482_02221 [Natrialba chahannaoensis JCM 10990]|uniref:Uncharacterized protein n=1 Tax=Natrialba chahannaoensis JCM 10990 TaxID=1227492 RepID=M0B399_9EURY|nr:hypothetical protein [Natrialba chahannaoensis]ELZ05386.1 hypothetical protein C482_02221 [Natrialba chahannaoensis JCM 10990]